MVDTFRLSQIEDKEEDVDMLYALSIITMTRINKVLTKTTSLRNLAAKFFFDQGFIIGNNPNINRIELNKKISAKFRGAFVADPNLMQACGMMVNGRRLATIFKLVFDLDLASLKNNNSVAYKVL